MDNKDLEFGGRGTGSSGSTENHLQRGVTAYHPETAIPVIVHPRTSTDGSVDSALWPRQPLSTSGQVFLNYDH